MRSKNAPTAAQKRWREAVRELGSVISGGPAVIHHPVGCSGKHNKIEIGHWWLIPLTDEEHKALHAGTIDLSHTPWAGMTRKEFEKDCFQRVCFSLGFNGFDCTVSPEVDVAIMDYHR